MSRRSCFPVVVVAAIALPVPALAHGGARRDLGRKTLRRRE